MSGMLGRLVITSVPRGLDGGGGLQPVLRTAGLPPAVALRLTDVSAYPHPFSSGDPRNPPVFFHRIETAGGRTVHVLGALRDAGASYTGRSNHLAELLAVPRDATDSLPAGPAFALRGYRWFERWQGEPREEPLSDAPPLPGQDHEDPDAPGRLATCPLWKHVAGDAGWAGELAKAFLEGRGAVIDTSNPHADVLGLFVEALRLLPVRDRWRVTFNTCELEPFPAAWRARRIDLPLVGPSPRPDDLRLILDELKKHRAPAPDHAFSRYARGETPAPWRSGPTPRAAAARIAAEAGADATLAGTPLTAAANGSFTGHGTGSADHSVRARLADIRAHRHTVTGSGPSRLPIEAEATPRRWHSWGWLAAIAVPCVVSCVFIGCFPDQARQLLEQPRQLLGVKTSHSARDLDSYATALPSPAEWQEREDRQQRQAEEARQAAAESARKEAEAADRARAVAEAQRKQRERDEAERRRQTEATRAAESKMRRQKQIAAWKALAFDGIDFKPLAPPPGPRGPADRGSDDTILCPFDAEHLIEPAFECACVPGPNVDPLEVAVERDATAAGDAGGPSWVVTANVLDEFSGRKRRRVVCRLVAVDGSLKLRWPRRPEQPVTVEDRVFAALQNSLLLISARDPDADTAAATTRRTIAFAMPVFQPELKLDPLTGKQEGDFDPQLARRIQEIDPAALRWDFELTHPAWQAPQHLRFSDTSLRVSLPPGGVPLAYEDVDGTTGQIVKRQGHLRIEAEIRVSSADGTLTIHPVITGLDDMPLLKKAISLDALARVRDSEANDSDANNSDANNPLRQAISTAFGGQQAKEKFYSAQFNKYLADKKPKVPGSNPEQRITNEATWRSFLNRVIITMSRIPRPGTNIPRADGKGQDSYLNTPANQEHYKTQVKPHEEAKLWLEQIKTDFENDLLSRTCRDITEIVETLTKHAKDLKVSVAVRLGAKIVIQNTEHTLRLTELPGE